MVFSSFIFLFFFLPIALALYYITPRRFRNTMLLVVSLFFYGWGEPVYLLLMLSVILINYICARIIAQCSEQKKRKKCVLIISIILNMALLCWFKYIGFAMKSVHALGFLNSVSVPDIVLPIGISFYIFQSTSYTIDVYRDEVDAERNILTFACYVSMFPQLIAGPIVRYRDVALQLKERRENYKQFSDGVILFIIGLSKKVLLANPMGSLWNTMSAAEGTVAAWVGMIAYSLQIYFDFSGYSDMAIGLGKMFGFDYKINFNYPYVSQSVTEFWRRWHISLSDWFKEYVYYPLGGNRRGLPLELRNILIVWMLTGLWHGASWNFVLWGLYYAVLLIIEKLFMYKIIEKLPSLLKHIILLFIVSVGWMLFFFEDTSQLFAFFERLFYFVPTGQLALSKICAYLPLVFIAFLGSTPLFKKAAEKFKPGILKNTFLIILLTLLFVMCIAALAGGSYNPFIYFRF